MRGAHQKKICERNPLWKYKNERKNKRFRIEEDMFQEFHSSEIHSVLVNDIWKGAGAQDNFCLGLSLKSALQAIHIVVIINKLG